MFFLFSGLRLGTGGKTVSTKCDFVFDVLCVVDLFKKMKLKIHSSFLCKDRQHVVGQTVSLINIMVFILSF